MTLRLYLHSPKVIMAAQVDLHGAAAVYPQNEIDFKNVSAGSHTAILPGMTVLYGTAPGKDDLGRNRIRVIDPTNPTFRTQVGRFSRGIGDGEVTLIENSHMTVLEDFRVWAKIPRMLGAVIRKDGDVGSFGNVDKPIPVANAGPGVAGIVDPVTGYLNVTFDGVNSWAFSAAASPPIVSVSGYQWSASGGTITTGTASSEVMTMRFTRGFYTVYLTVTGGDHAQQHTCQVPVFACDPAWASDPAITEFQVSSHIHTLVGQEMTIEFFTPLPRDQYPDGTLMMLWDDALAYDPAMRLHMQFVGWHQQDEAGVRAEPTATLHSTRMTFYDVNRRLETLPGFSQVVEYNAAPTQWTQTKFPNVLYYFWYVLYWHSTAVEVADLLVDMAQTLAIMEYVTLGSDRGNLYAQVNSLAAQVSPDHRLTCSRQGQMRLVVDPMIQNVSERGTTIWAHFTDGDWVEVRYSYARPPRVNRIRTMAIVSRRTYVVVDGENTIEVIACLAPGEAHGQGEQDMDNNERIVVNQNQLNITEGNRYARMNPRYGRFTITMPLEKMYAGLDLSVPYWVNLTLSAGNKPERELPASFTAQRGQVMEMSISYDYQETGLVRTVTLQWEMESSGPAAQTLVLWPEVPDPETLVLINSQGTEPNHA